MSMIAKMNGINWKVKKVIMLRLPDFRNENDINLRFSLCF